MRRTLLPYLRRALVGRRSSVGGQTYRSSSSTSRYSPAAFILFVMLQRYAPFANPQVILSGLRYAAASGTKTLSSCNRFIVSHILPLLLSENRAQTRSIQWAGGTK